LASQNTNGSPSVLHNVGGANRISMSAATPPAWPKTSTAPCATSPPQHGHLTPEKADTYVKKLATDKRYVRDVY
jgi:hypothetical protein